MADTINARHKVKRDTTAHWNSATGFVPLEGEIIVYTDYKTDGNKTIPGIKIGSGNAYVQDLAFIDEDTRRTLAEHIEDLDIHVTAEEKAFWNNKVNTEDTVVGETLVFTRT